MIDLLIEYKQARTVAKNYWVMWAQIIKKDTLVAIRAKAKAEAQDLVAEAIYQELLAEMQD